MKKKYNVSLVKPFYASESSSLEDEGKSQEIEDEGKSQEIEDEGKSQEIEDEVKSQEIEEEVKSQEIEDEGKSQEIEDEGKSQEIGGEPEAETTHTNLSSRKIQKNYFDLLPTEIVVLILEHSMKNDFDTFKSIVNTCSRFRTIIQPRRSSLLPSVYLDFYSDFLEKLPFYGNKVKVSVIKLSRHFGSGSGAINDICKAITHKNWKSAWLILEKQKHSWFLIDRVFWRKSFLKTSQLPETETNEWLRNRLYILKQKDKDILISKDSWLNDNLMDAAQKLICQEIGTPLTFQTVLNSQKKDVEPYEAVNQEHIQLLHDGRNHWILSFCSNGRVQVCDSLNKFLTRSSRKAIKSLYKNFFTGTEIISFIEVQKQPDAYNCGLFAIAYAAELLDGKSPSNAVFAVDRMRAHLISCLEEQKLKPFPKVSET